MKKVKTILTNEAMENVIGNLLRIGVISAAALVLIGGGFYLAKHGTTPPEYSVYHLEPANMRSIPGIIKRAFALDSRGLIQLGLLLLIATPVARVAFSVFAFAMQRDYTYIIVTLIVLTLLLFSLSGGCSG